MVTTTTLRIVLAFATFALLFALFWLFVKCCQSPSSSNQAETTTDHNHSCNNQTSTAKKKRELVVEEILTTFPSYTYGEDESPPSRSSVCSICLSEYQNGERLRLLPNCGHVFHKGCIDLWLSTRSSSCPICRDQAVAVTNPSGDDDNGGVAGSGGSLIPPWNINFGTGTGHVL